MPTPTITERLITFKNNLVTAKNNLASAITAKGVTAAGTDSFANLTTKIGNIQAAGGEVDYDIFSFFVNKRYSNARNPSNGISLVLRSNTSFMNNTNSSYHNLYSNIANNDFYVQPPTVSGHSNTALLSLDLLIDINYFAADGSARSPVWPPVYRTKIELCPQNNDWSKFSSILKRKIITNNSYYWYGISTVDSNTNNGTYDLNTGNPYITGLTSSTTYFYLKPITTLTNQLFAQYQLWATFAYQKTT